MYLMYFVTAPSMSEYPSTARIWCYYFTWRNFSYASYTRAKTSYESCPWTCPDITVSHEHPVSYLILLTYLFNNDA